MTTQRKPGRPPKQPVDTSSRGLMSDHIEQQAAADDLGITLGTGVRIVLDDPIMTLSQQPKEEIMPNKAGTFITVNTKHSSGIRLNLDKIRTYAKNEDTTIHIAWENGMATSLIYNNKEERDAALDLMDKYCL